MRVSKKITDIKKKPLGGAAGGGGADGGGGSGGLVWLCAHRCGCMDAGTCGFGESEISTGKKQRKKIGIENGKLEI